MLFEEYQYILKYFFFSFFVVLLLFVVSFFFVYQSSDLEKNSAYECGFNPFEDARTNLKFVFT